MTNRLRRVPLIAALMVLPVVLLFGVRPSLGQDKAVAAPKSSGSSGARSSPPSGDCLRRFLAPIEQLAGAIPERSPAGAASSSAKAAAPGDAPPSTALPGPVPKTDETRASLVRGDAPSGEGDSKEDSKKGTANSDAPPKDGDWLSAAKRAVTDLRTTLGDEAKIDAIIATVPDPMDSGLAYLFDTTLQALRLGLERGIKEPPPPLRFSLDPDDDVLSPEYVPLYRDRSWLPWRDRDASGTARPEATECRETTPGLMVFRDGAATARRVRLLLLIGESPTRGVHIAAMVNALELVHAMTACTGVLERDAKTGPPSCVTRIIAPTFSGGAFSLRLALEKWAKDAQIDAKSPAPFYIVTGSATGSALPSTLGGDAGWPPSLQVWFESTTAPDSAVECAYLHLLQRLGTETDPSQLPNAPSKLLPQVAMLHESGTEFGASTESVDGRCGLRPGVQISFPVHIASLRDAYEELDRKEAAKEKDAIARPTSLEVSLHEKHSALDAQANPSPKTTYAQDVALTNVLTQISVEKVRHVGIHATDVADAIFLARKIRDVAPDVRLAFFESDTLLLHPTFQRDLRGSLIVSPYVFLGSSPFRAPALDGLRAYAPFENAAAEGTFNAVLAARAWRFDRLLEYTVPQSSVALPIWHSTIGRNGIVPLGAVRPVDCAGIIYRGGLTRTTDELLAKLCASEKPPAGTWTRFNTVRALDLRSDVPLPRLWHLLFAFLVLGFAVDQRMLWKTRHSLARNPMPSEISEMADHESDLAIGRTKWLLYATIRTFLFALAFLYIALIDRLCALATTTDTGLAEGVQAKVMTLALAASFGLSLRRFWQFAANYVEFGKTVARSSAFASRRAMFRLVLDAFSLTNPVSRVCVARTSFAQLGTIALLAVGLSAFFTNTLFQATFEASSARHALSTHDAVPALTLLVLRTVALGNGVSPAAPALLFLASVYLWVTGRMARLAAAHGISRLSPNDGEADLVSTPLRLVLYPSYDPCAPSSGYTADGPPPSDGGFTRVERSVANAIWRPITGPVYLGAVGVVIAVPLVLFLLKPLATVEVAAGTRLLGGGLAISSSLIGITLLQLIRYWLALEHMLKRTMNHPLGPALGSARQFVRESIDDHLSRSPNDLLRLTTCSLLFEDLVQATRAHERIDLGRAAIADFDALQSDLETARNEALDASSQGSWPRIADKSARLGQCVILAASRVTKILEYAWKGQAGVFHPRADGSRAESVPQMQAVGAAAAVSGGAVPEARDGTTRTSGKMPSGTQALANADAHLVPPVALVASASPAVTVAHAVAPAPRQPAQGQEPSGSGNDALAPVAWRFEAGELAWLRQCQAFVSTVVALLVSRYVRQFRYFLYAMTAAIALLLVALSSYPFEPHRLLLSCSWAIVGSVVGAGLWIFIELDRNTVMSHLTGTDPGKLTWNTAFVVRVLAWVALPLLGVAATTYPDIANMLYQLVEPFVRALR